MIKLVEYNFKPNCVNSWILNPEAYTVWFKIIFDEFYHYLEDHKL